MTMRLTFKDHREKIFRVIGDQHGLYTDAFKLALKETMRRLDAAERVVEAANAVCACTCTDEPCSALDTFRRMRASYDSIVREQGNSVCSCSPKKRCDFCGWPIKATIADGCTVDSCSLRPLPDKRSHCAECEGSL